MHQISRPILNASRNIASVVTFHDFPAPPETVWQVLLFYEEITKCPPFLLRWFLPIPVATEGGKFEVGGQIKCHYSKGHLLKRVTQIVGGSNYSFEVVEQKLSLGGIRLLGGEYTLSQLSKDRTRMALATRYESPNQPRWLYGRLEALVCHSFHRHILTAMQSNLTQREAA